MTRRLFVSLPIQENFRSVFNTYRDEYAIKGIRWIPSESYHITLHFLGDTPEEAIPGIEGALETVAKAIYPFDLEFWEVSFAPPGKFKRMVWGVFQRSEAFQELVTRVPEAVSSAKSLELRESIPHVTLARIRNPKSIQGIKLRQPDIDDRILRVNRLELQESYLAPSGAQYRVLKAFQLGEVE